MKYIKCLKHLLKNLQTNKYCYHIKQLLECCTEFEYNFTRQKVAAIFQNDIKKEEELLKSGKRPVMSVKQSISDCLDKVGLAYITTTNSIEINDEDKWKKSSMIYRLQYNMPSTKNSLESYHGHLNKYTSRKNNFFNSTCRIASNPSFKNIKKVRK